ncbi:MAG: hypothetical protein QXS97_08440 [Desulfurococcus sp.]|uniref:hypothetical protein n=1 Tax=Desulfurococcus sp. TaxID=51678 RepID=UPI003178800E
MDISREDVSTILSKLVDKTGISVNRDITGEVEALLSDPGFNNVVKYIDKYSRIALAIYMVLRRHGICISVRCIMDYARIPRTSFTELLGKLGVKPCSIEEYVLYAADKLGLSRPIASNTLWIARRIRGMSEKTGPSPSVIAASSLYLASQYAGYKIPQKIIASTLCVSEVSLRNTCRNIVGLLGERITSYIDEVDKTVAMKYIGEPPEGIPLALLREGEPLSILILQESRIKPWSEIALASGLPVEGSIVILDITYAENPEYGELALDKALVYLKLKGYRYIWSVNNSIKNSLLSKGFRPVWYLPGLKKIVYAREIS